MEYYYDGGRLISEDSGADFRMCLYDSLGPCAMLRGADLYYFVRNALGDAVGIADWGDRRRIGHRARCVRLHNSA